MSPCKFLDPLGLIEETPFRAQHMGRFPITRDVPVEGCEPVVEFRNLERYMEQRATSCCGKDEKNGGGRSDHAASPVFTMPQDGASVRSPTRSRAERARGLLLVSASPGRMARRVGSRQAGA